MPLETGGGWEGCVFKHSPGEPCMCAFWGV